MADEKIRIVIQVIDKAKTGLASLTRGLKSVTGAIFSMKTGLAALAGAAGIGLLIKQSLAATDSLAKTASKIGTTTEALSKLQYAGQLSGLSIENTNMSLQRFSRRVSEAAKGTGEAQSALRELGLDANVLNRQGLSTTMLDVADAFQQVEGGANQLRLAFKLFDSEGAQMVNMLRNGSGALISMYADAKNLGVVMRASVAASVERTNDAFTRLGYLFRGVRDQIVGALAPALTLLVTKITEFFAKIAQSEGGIERWARAVTSKFLASIASMLEGISRAVKGIQDFVNGLIDMVNWVRDNIMRIDKLDHVVFGVGDSAANAAKTLREMAEAVVAVGDGMVITISKGAETANVFDRIAAAITTASEAMPGIDQAMTSLATGAMSTMTDELTNAITGAKNFSDAMKDMARSVVNSLIKMLVQYYITKPLFDAITGFIGGVGGGGPTGLGPTTTSGRAVGGPVSSGTPYMVGERGPELFVPNSSGQISPNGRMGAGGVTVNQTINISTGVAQTVRAEVANLMPQIAESAKSAVAEGKMRGGNFSKSLVGA